MLAGCARPASLLRRTASAQAATAILLMQMCVTGKPVDDDTVVPLSSIVEGPRSLRRQQASIARAALSCRVRLSAVLVDEPKRDGRAGHALAAAAATERRIAADAIKQAQKTTARPCFNSTRVE